MSALEKPAHDLPILFTIGISWLSDKISLTLLKTSHIKSNF